MPFYWHHYFFRAVEAYIRSHYTTSRKRNSLFPFTPFTSRPPSWAYGECSVAQGLWSEASQMLLASQYIVGRELVEQPTSLIRRR